MYTGKPYIGELGYAFLFRNYRSDYGKWQTTDPLGYPDGWNNLAYCNNMFSFCIDWLGNNLYELLDVHAVKGLGHSLPIGTKLNSDGTWTATGYDYGGISTGNFTTRDVKTFTGTSEQEVLTLAIGYFDPNGNKYDAMYGWKIDSQKSQQALDAMSLEVKMSYSGEKHNCLNITKAGLTAAGVYLNDSEWRPVYANEMRRNSRNFTDFLKKVQE
jgi:hypothetical protein